MKAVILSALAMCTTAASLDGQEFTAQMLEDNEDTFHSLLQEWDQEVESLMTSVDSLEEEEWEPNDSAYDVLDYLGYTEFHTYLKGPMMLQAKDADAEELSVRKKAQAEMRDAVKQNIRPKKYTKKEQVDFNSAPIRETPQWAGILPQLGRNLFSMVVADMNNAYVAHASMVQWLMDIVLWIFLPIIGGFVGIATFIAFESDKLTFHHMGLDQNSLYQGEMLFLKGIIYSAMGRPNFYKEQPEEPLYVPKRDMDPVNIPPTDTKPPVLEEEEIEEEVVGEEEEEVEELDEEMEEEDEEDFEDEFESEAI